MISLHIVKQNKVLLNITNIGYKVKDVQKNSVPHQGMAIRVVVSENIGDNMSIAYQYLLKFNVIHTNFPYEVLTYIVTANVMAKIKNSFSDVLSDNLNTTPIKTLTPMVIILKCQLLKVLAARRVPRRYEQPTEMKIQDLINKGVLARFLMSQTGAVQASSYPNPTARYV